MNFQLLCISIKFKKKILLFYHDSAVPPAPIVNSARPLATEVTIHLTRVKGNYHLSNFCCYFTRQSVSDIHMSSLPSVMICNKTSPVVLSPIQEDATYTYHCVARNTYNASDGNATEQKMFSTTATGREPVSEICFRICREQTSKSCSCVLGKSGELKYNNAAVWSAAYWPVAKALDMLSSALYTSFKILE